MRSVVRVVALAWIAGLTGYVAADLATLQDFIEYWSASRLHLTGGDPYNADQLLPLQQSLGPDHSTVIMMWNPPWTLALLMPLGVLPFETARWIWLSLHFAILLGCIQWLWHFFGGRERGAWLASGLGLLFAPAFLALGMGQISPLLLLGLCGFLHHERRGQPIRAGAFAALTLIKPHWLYLFWIALLVWSVSRRRFRIAGGAAGVVVIALGLVSLVNPSVIEHYLSAVRESPPDYFVAPTGGVLMRLLFGWESSWPQFLPMLPGVIWLTWYWQRHRQSWEWAQAISSIVLVSAFTTAYGWSFDQVVLLIPLLWMAATFRDRPSLRVAAGLGCYVAGSLLLFKLWPLPLLVASAESRGGLLSVVLLQPNMFWQIVILPVFMVGYGLAASPKAVPEGRSARSTA